MAPFDDFQELIYTVRDGVAWVELNRPEQSNALTARLYGEVKWAVRLADLDDAVDVLVITGRGKSFAPGGDLKESYERITQPNGVLHMMDMSDNKPFDALRSCSKPIIAAINGACVAGGLIIAAWCDIQIAVKSAMFGLPEAKVGMIEAYAPYVLYGRMPLPKLKYHYLTAKYFTAEQAEDWEIITEVVADGELERRVLEVVQEIRGTSPVARPLLKKYLHDLVPYPSDTGSVPAWSSPEFVEGIKAFAEKRDPIYTKEQQA